MTAVQIPPFVDAGGVAVAIATIALVVVALSTLSIAYVQYRRHLASVPEYVRRERLRAYSAVMSEMVALNRLAVELDEDDRFGLEHRKYAMSKDSAIEEPVADLTETFQRYYHVLDPEVQNAVDDYLDYLSMYDQDPSRPPIATVLNKSRGVVTAMRTDLGLASFGPDPTTTAESSDSGGENRRDDPGSSDDQ